MTRYTYKVLLILLITSCMHTMYAQRDPMYSQYMFNMLVINPAYAGNKDVAGATLVYRRQWYGMEGAPRTTTFSIDAPFKQKQVGIGLNVVNDKTGIFYNTNVTMSVSYKLRFEKSSLAFGIQAGISNYLADFASVPTLPYGNNEDGAFSRNISYWQPNIGTGFFYSSAKFYAGLSALNMLNNNYQYDQNYASALKPNYFRNVFATVGYVFHFNRDIVLKPSGIIKYSHGAPLQIDVNCNVWFYDLVGLGASYRTFNAFYFLFEIKASPQIKFGYAYDQPYTPFGQYSGGCHEFMLRYDFFKTGSKVITPRYF